MQSYDAILIDAGTGNLHSVHNALLQLGFQVRVSNHANDLRQPGRVVLPGVGAFGHFMQGLRDHELVEPLREVAQRGDPLLGICVGMQALFELSEEMGQHAGLNLLLGKVATLSPSSQTGKSPTRAGISSGLAKVLPCSTG